MSAAERMTTVERRATFGLASIFGLRMLGMFLILPVFAIHAQHLPGGDDHTLVGLALGAYGLTQAMLQLPFGMASDRFGRKRVIFFGLLLFILGSIVAALATDVQTVVIGRAIQGAGAISAAVMALLADLTREEHRTHAMAMIGSTIGLTFAFSLAAGPALYRWLSVPGIFALTAVLGTLALWVVWRVIPDPQASHFHSDAEVTPATMGDVLRHRGLLRLNLRENPLQRADLLRVHRGGHILVAGIVQQALEQLHVGFLVVDDQDPGVQEVSVGQHRVVSWAVRRWPPAWIGAPGSHATAAASVRYRT